MTLKIKTALAELAGANTLRGKVCVTDAKGTTHHYANEAAADAVWGGKVGSLEHRRGAFFEVTTKPKAAVPKVEVAVEAEKSSKSSGKRSRD